MMSSVLGLGAFSRASSRPPSLDHFPRQLSFLELATEFSTTPPIEDSHFVLPSCLDGAHQGDSLYRKTTHNKYQHIQKLIHVWHGSDMVIHMMPTLAHMFIDYEKDPWSEPNNGI
jgi:hypothetical protein